MMQTLTSKYIKYTRIWRTQWVGEQLFTLIYTEMFTFPPIIHKNVFVLMSKMYRNNNQISVRCDESFESLLRKSYFRQQQIM